SEKEGGNYRMQKQQLFDLQEGDCIYVYSGGHLEAQGRYIGVIKDKNESFLCWRKHNGNEVYTNLNGIRGMCSNGTKSRNKY
ncbi:hypothetical protein P9011_32850, partial [Bacillus thuringiensis]|nr:hypothetical protein [Bacillus thuringiensis]